MVYTVIVAGLLSLLALVSATAANAGPAEVDFAARCQGATSTTSGAGGVLRCFSFDTAADLPRTNGAGSNECWGCDFGIMANNNNPNVPVIDTVTKASGGGSMRFNQIAGGGSSGAGSWFTHFGPNKTGQVTTGQQIWVQYRVRWSPELMVNSMWPGSGGAKVMDISLGDTPTCNSSFPDSVNCPTSCPAQGFEFVLQNNGQFGMPSVYANCNGTAAFNAMAGGSGLNPEFQNMVHCAYPTFASPPCKRFVTNQWMTFKIKLGIGGWNAWANPVQVWFGYEGEPLTLIIDCETAQPNKCTAGFPASNGWWFENSNPAVYKMGKVYLHPYQTCQIAPCNWGSSTATAWYDELIISTQDIADPGGVTPLAPSAPCCLTLTRLTPFSLVLLVAMLLSRRQWYRLGRSRHFLGRIRRTIH